MLVDNSLQLYALCEWLLPVVTSLCEWLLPVVTSQYIIGVLQTPRQVPIKQPVLAQHWSDTLELMESSS